SLGGLCLASRLLDPSLHTPSSIKGIRLSRLAACSDPKPTSLQRLVSSPPGIKAMVRAGRLRENRTPGARKVGTPGPHQGASPESFRLHVHRSLRASCPAPSRKRVSAALQTLRSTS